MESNVSLTTITSGYYIVKVKGELPSKKSASTQFSLRLIKCKEAVINATSAGLKTSYTFDMTVE